MTYEQALEKFGLSPDIRLRQMFELGRLAAPIAQEPVAWVPCLYPGHYITLTKPPEGWKMIPLYTAPPAAQPAPVQPMALRDALADSLGCVYVCDRVWSAWGVGTMTQDDFYPAAESDEVLDSLVEAVAKAIPPAAQPAPVPLTVAQKGAIHAATASMRFYEAVEFAIRKTEAAHGITEKGKP
jgi:hypothetical protein